MFWNCMRFSFETLGIEIQYNVTYALMQNPLRLMLCCCLYEILAEPKNNVSLRDRLIIDSNSPYIIVCPVQETERSSRGPVAPFSSTIY
jgi:hypothetical protein